MSQLANRRSLSVPGFRSAHSNRGLPVPIPLSFRSNALSPRTLATDEMPDTALFVDPVDEQTNQQGSLVGWGCAALEGAERRETALETPGPNGATTGSPPSQPPAPPRT